jgi:hypothetical protein
MILTKNDIIIITLRKKLNWKNMTSLHEQHIACEKEVREAVHHLSQVKGYLNQNSIEKEFHEDQFQHATQHLDEVKEKLNKVNERMRVIYLSTHVPDLTSDSSRRDFEYVQLLKSFTDRKGQKEIKDTSEEIKNTSEEESEEKIVKELFNVLSMNKLSDDEYLYIANVFGNALG